MCIRLQSVIRLVIVLCGVFAAAPARAQLDPLLFLKVQTLNVVLVVDTSARMQRDADGTYYDPSEYSTGTQLFYTPGNLLGAPAPLPGSRHRRAFVGFAAATQGSATYTGTKVIGVNTTNATAMGAKYFYDPTRLVVARRALQQAVLENIDTARFSLIKTRQEEPLINWTTFESVSVDGQLGDSSNSSWRVLRTRLVAKQTRRETEAKRDDDAAWTSPQPPLVRGDSAGATTNVRAILESDFWPPNTPLCDTIATPTIPCALAPAGKDWTAALDAPIGSLLDDARAEAERLIEADTTGCRNTVVVLVAGGRGSRLTTAELRTKAQSFTSIRGRRVPIFVIGIGLDESSEDAAQLRAIATDSGGEPTIITKGMIARTPLGSPVPEVVRAVNRAIQSAITETAREQEYQTTSPIVGTVNLKGAQYYRPDGSPATLPDSETEIKHARSGNTVPQRFNVLVSSGFKLPNFDGMLRAIRVYKPVRDDTKSTGYTFTQDGARLWTASVPAAANRNIYTVLPNGSMVAFNAANVNALVPYLRLPGESETEIREAALGLISYVRSRNLGAVIGSTPAFLDPPSLDPPPDLSYPAFRDRNKQRRTLIFVGANDGMMHAIDGRTGVEVWAFVPFNLLPKLQVLPNGQTRDNFKYFVDSSPKLSDVRINGQWRTYLIFGQGKGGTFYNSFDVTLDNMADVVSDTASVDDVLAYFATPSRIAHKWSFPRNSSFDVSISTDHAPYGDLSTGATDVEKTVGETWSVPAIGQLANESGPYTVLVGSGFMKRSIERQANRGGAPAGRNFYVLDVATGNVLATSSVGADTHGEEDDDCRQASNCGRIKNALQMDPVAAGPGDSRFVTKAYMGDLDGRLWRFDITLDGTTVRIAAPTKLYDAGASQPMFSSMATVNVGGSKQYIFLGTGSDMLPSNGVNDSYRLLVLLDNGTSSTRTAEILLEKTDGEAGDEKVTAFPAVAGDIVFFTTTTVLPAQVCAPFYAQLYAFTFIGGPAYDTNNDGRFTADTSSATRQSNSAGRRGGGGRGSDDDVLVSQIAGVRATAPFIVDQHLVFGTGGTLQMFGDPNDFNNGVGQAGAKILSWRLLR